VVVEIEDTHGHMMDNWVSRSRRRRGATLKRLSCEPWAGPELSEPVRGRRSRSALRRSPRDSVAVVRITYTSRADSRAVLTAAAAPLMLRAGASRPAGPDPASIADEPFEQAYIPVVHPGGVLAAKRSDLRSTPSGAAPLQRRSVRVDGRCSSFHHVRAAGGPCGSRGSTRTVSALNGLGAADTMLASTPCHPPVSALNPNRRRPSADAREFRPIGPCVGYSGRRG
jgi:hypothetical protein